MKIFEGIVKRNLENHTDEDVRKLYADCEATLGGTLGHSKAFRLRGSMRHFKTELERRGSKVPTCNESEELGEWNGPGVDFISLMKRD